MKQKTIIEFENEEIKSSVDEHIVVLHLKSNAFYSITNIDKSREILSWFRQIYFLIQYFHSTLIQVFQEDFMNRPSEEPFMEEKIALFRKCWVLSKTKTCPISLLTRVQRLITTNHIMGVSYPTEFLNLRRCGLDQTDSVIQMNFPLQLEGLLLSLEQLWI